MATKKTTAALTRKIHRKKRDSRKIEREAAKRCYSGNGSSPGGGNDSFAGTNTTDPHPYGVLPYGNIYIHEKGDIVRSQGLGGYWRVLNDEQVRMVLTFCDGTTLARVTQCSQFLYVMGNEAELWRDLTLRWCDMRHEAVDFYHSWRDTYVRRQIEMHNKQSTIGSSPLHVPFPVRGIFSDVLHRSHLCRSFPLPLENMCAKVESVPAEEMTVERFQNDFEQLNKPVVIRGATRNWPALKNWKDPSYLEGIAKNQFFRATSGAAALPASFTFSSYQRYCQAHRDEAPLYVFDRSTIGKCPQIKNDYVPALRKTCPYFNDACFDIQHDLFQHLGSERRPDFRWIIMGPQRSGSSFHIDPNGTHAWNAPIVGRKRWIFYPPGVNPPGVHPSPSGDDVAMPISLGEWFLCYYGQHLRQNQQQLDGVLECTVEPGDILFVPHGWWHSVLNLDPSMSIALTQNYVSRSNLPDVLRFLQKKQTQISGCRDRTETIKPEHLLEEFRKVLKKVHPKLLDEAEVISNDRWTCRAWHDEDTDSSEEPTLMKKRTRGHDDHLVNRRSQKGSAPRGEGIMDLAKTSYTVDKNVADHEASSSGFSFSFM